ncbi:hypothetical protein KORDIASMS9_03474 [Kordia sp. SMS9]|uniref:hypothetical protein n=1 Tax=Kordia sp. SMS9 TaxID=2282170 RepID=UPI000E0D9040|nr:hypothetical protein [Kordia sp. SMS9]AXG71218.1 hypothetical protein KORDIASMS9_03474 [Kordia sp. SMS9]
MKKRNLKSLALNKKSISKLGIQNGIVGGFKTESCPDAGICCPTHDSACPTHDCTGGGTTNPPGTQTCNLACNQETISCPGAGIC